MSLTFVITSLFKSASPEMVCHRAKLQIEFSFWHDRVIVKIWFAMFLESAQCCFAVLYIQYVKQIHLVKISIAV